MPKASLIQTNFNGGEYSQGLRMRAELELYQTGAEKIQNFFPTKEGNLKYRTGIYYDRSTKSDNETESDNETVFISFISSSSERYVLEFSNLILRVFKDNVQIGTDITSPYRTQDLPNLQYAQEKAIMILVDGVHTPYRLVAGTIFTLSAELFDYETDTAPPFRAENLTAQTMTASATTGSITITSSVAYFNDPLDVGRYIKIRDAGNFGFARITAVNSPTQVNATVTKALPDTSPHTSWSISMTPKAVAFFEQRLLYGEFNKFVLSMIPDDDGIVRYNDFTLGTAVEDAMAYESGLLRGEIQWLSSTDRIIAIGTYTGVFKASSGNLEESLSPVNPPTVKQISVEGTINIQPIQRDNVVFFLSRDTKRVLSLGYNFESDGYKIRDNMLLSDDIAQEGITQLDYRLGNENILYAVKTDGELIGMVHNPSQQINGWFRVVTDGYFESVVTVPDSDGKDVTYVVVKRTINSVEKRYVEYFTEEVLLPKRDDYYTDDKDTDEENFLFDMWEAQKDFVYLDSALIYDGSSQSVTMTPEATTGLDKKFTSGGALFVAGDVGREIWEKSGTGRAKIITYTSNTEVQCNILSAFASTNTLNAGDWYFTSNNFTGLSHLEGETVGVIRDGGEDGDTYTVSGGEITITQQASKVTIGLKYTGIFKSMSLQGGSANGSSQAKAKLINRIGVYFLNSVNAKFGTDIYNLNSVLFGASKIMGRAIAPYTGFKKFDIPERYEEEKHIYAVQDSPVPCIIQAIVLLMEANDE